jgi:hypothetical protein
LPSLSSIILPLLLSFFIFFPASYSCSFAISPVPSQYLRITLTSHSHFCEGSSSHKKYIAFPLFLFFSMDCATSVLCILQLALTYSLAFSDLLFVFSILNFTQRFSIFFQAFDSLQSFFGHFDLSCISTGINTQVSVWPLECLLQVEFCSLHSRYFDVVMFLLVLWSFLFKLLICCFFFFYFSLIFPCPFLFLYKLFDLLLFVWTSGLSFCLIILVFARMSLRVINTARWFLMILQACWVSVCWGGRRFEVFNKILQVIHIIW